MQHTYELPTLNFHGPTNPVTPFQHEPKSIVSYPTMSEIMQASASQSLNLELRTLGPFFRITAKSLVTNRELGKAEGLVRFWWGGRILHLDSIKLSRETLGMEKSIFGIGIFLGAVAIRHGYDCGCEVAQLLAINDSDLYHSKLVRFYTRIGFKTVYEVTGSSIADLAHMLVWGGIGTRMDASVEELLIKWCTRDMVSLIENMASKIEWLVCETANLRQGFTSTKRVSGYINGGYGLTLIENEPEHCSCV